MVKRDQKALIRIIRRLESEYQEEAKEAAEELYTLLDRGYKVEAALVQLRKDHPALFQLSGLQEAMVEAAAYGYGIVPAILTDTQVKAWRRALSKSWDDSGMTLSEKIHGAGVKMRESIISTIRSQMRRNATWTSMARELYDGYNSGKAVTMQQALPKYLQAVRNAYGTPRIVAESRKALRNIERLSQNGAPTKALKAAYKQLIETAQTGTEEALNKACWVAMQEKSRYIADRIARTEMARAWADGFLADIMQDDDVVAVKWKLSSRHPVFDVCDMYAKADMYGLGAGIYPKDKLPPLPVHPHCLCRYVEVIEGEVDMQQQRDQVQGAGNKWLNSLPESRRVQVLGRKGLKAWEDGEDWRKYMRGYAGLREAESRLSGIKIQLHAGKKSNEELMAENLVPPTDEFIESIAEKAGAPYTKGKKGEDRFYDDDGNPIYPPNNGAVGKEEKTTLPRGMIISRYGNNYGRYVSPDGTTIEERALAKDARIQNELHRFKLAKDVECIKGVIASWFGQAGGGIQYKFSKTVDQLIKEGVLIEI